MSNRDTQNVGVLEKQSSSAFLVAGGLFVLFAGFWGAFAFTAMDSEVVQNVVGPAGWTVAFVGLLGLYRRLADENRRLSIAAAVFAVLGFAGAVITTLGNFVVLLNAVDALPEWFAALQLPLLVGIVPGFFTYAFATHRTDSISRRVSLLLLAPGAIFVLNFIRVATLGSTTPIWAPFMLGAGQALSLLAIGYSLYAEREFPN